jgi:hypothetical protein
MEWLSSGGRNWGSSVSHFLSGANLRSGDDASS